MARPDGESLNTLFETLADWSNALAELPEGFFDGTDPPEP